MSTGIFCSPVGPLRLSHVFDEELERLLRANGRAQLDAGEAVFVAASREIAIGGLLAAATFFSTTSIAVFLEDFVLVDAVVKDGVVQCVVSPKGVHGVDSRPGSQHEVHHLGLPCGRRERKRQLSVVASHSGREEAALGALVQ